MSTPPAFLTGTPSLPLDFWLNFPLVRNESDPRYKAVTPVETWKDFLAGKTLVSTINASYSVDYDYYNPDAPDAGHFTEVGSASVTVVNSQTFAPTNKCFGVCPISTLSAGAVDATTLPFGGLDISGGSTTPTTGTVIGSVSQYDPDDPDGTFTENYTFTGASTNVTLDLRRSVTTNEFRLAIKITGQIGISAARGDPASPIAVNYFACSGTIQAWLDAAGGGDTVADAFPGATPTAITIAGVPGEMIFSPVSYSVPNDPPAGNTSRDYDLTGAFSWT